MFVQEISVPCHLISVELHHELDVDARLCVGPLHVLRPLALDEVEPLPCGERRAHG